MGEGTALIPAALASTLANRVVLFCPNCSIHTKVQLGEMKGFLWQITIKCVKYSKRNRTKKVDVPRYTYRKAFHLPFQSIFKPIF